MSPLQHGGVQKNAQILHPAVLQHGRVQKNAQILHPAVLQHGGVQKNAQIMHPAVLLINTLIDIYRYVRVKHGT